MTREKETKIMEHDAFTIIIIRNRGRKPKVCYTYQLSPTDFAVSNWHLFVIGFRFLYLNKKNIPKH